MKMSASPTPGRQNPKLLLPIEPSATCCYEQTSISFEMGSRLDLDFNFYESEKQKQKPLSTFQNS